MVLAASPRERCAAWGLRCSVSWAELYERLLANRNDARAWSALEARVRWWVQRDAALPRAGWHVAEDVVADTCAEVVVSLEKARGGATFAGFVYGHFLNARRRILAEHWRTPQPLGERELPDPAG